MTTIGSASNMPVPNNPQGYFSTKVSDRGQRKDSHKLMENIKTYHQIIDRVKKEARLDKITMTYHANNVVSADSDRRQALLDKATIALNDSFTAIESGVALPKNAQEVLLICNEDILDTEDLLGTATLVDKTAKCLKKHQNDDCYDLDSLLQNTDKVMQKYLFTDFKNLKSALRGVFTENPQVLFEKGAAHPETVKRLVELLDLPAVNDKGWNLASQAAKVGNPKLVNTFENAGFGPNVHTKAVVDFAKAMTDGSNAEKSAALKELIGVTPLT